MLKSDANASLSSMPDVYPISSARLIVLHLLPGVIGTLVYIITAPVVISLGYPSLIALYLPTILTIVIVELGYLLYQGQKQNGSLSLKEVIKYREPVPRWQYLGFPTILILAAIIATALVSPLDNVIAEGVFGWLPGWYLIRDLSQFAQFGRQALITTMICALVLNGLVGPIVEELYFRGYLLPRLSGLGRWAPLVNVLLFSFYHFWTPWMFFSRVAVLLPMVYIVWWKRNIYLGMMTHCSLNLIGTTATFALILR